MATLPLPSISMLSPHFLGAHNGAGLPPLSPSSLTRMLDGREHPQQQRLASMATFAGAHAPALKPMGCNMQAAEVLPRLPSLGLPDTLKASQLPKGPTGSPLEPLAQVATGNICDEMDSAANAVLSAAPVTPPPEEPGSSSSALSIEALLTPRPNEGSNGLSFQPAGNHGSPSRPDSLRLPGMHSPSQSPQNAPTVSALCEAAAHQKAADMCVIKQEHAQPLHHRPVDRSRGRAGGRGDYGPQMNQSRYWTEAEHQRFLQAVRTFGAHNHKAIASFVATRSSAQVRSHSQKFFKKLETFRGQGLPSMTRKRKTLKDISMHQ